MAFTILTTSCRISITRNYYSLKPKAPKSPISADITTYVLKLGSQSLKTNDGQTQNSQFSCNVENNKTKQRN